MKASLASLKTRVQGSGLTLVETLLSLIIGAVILMGVLMYYQTASEKSKATATIKIVGDIGDAVRAYAQSPNYRSGSINLADLIALGLLSGSDVVNPWTGGNIIVSTSGNYLGISIRGIPARQTSAQPGGGAPLSSVTGICGILAAQLTRALPLPSPGTVTLNGTTYVFSNPSAGGIDVTVGESSQPKHVQGAAVCSYVSGTTGILNVIMDLS